MLSPERAALAAAEEFCTEAPPADAAGDILLALDGGAVLAVRSAPGGALVTWTRIAEAPPEQPARPSAEEHFLRHRRTRVRRSPQVVATRGADGSLILYTRSKPADEGEWLDSVAELLNEAEVARQHFSSET